MFEKAFALVEFDVYAHEQVPESDTFEHTSALANTTMVDIDGQLYCLHCGL